MLRKSRRDGHPVKVTVTGTVIKLTDSMKEKIKAGHPLFIAPLAAGAAGAATLKGEGEGEERKLSVY